VENPFGTDSTPQPEQPEGSLPPAVTPEEGPAVPAAQTSLDDFVNAETEPETADLGVDPNNVIQIRTSSGQSHYVAVSEATTLGRIKERSGLTYGAGTQFFLNNTVIGDDMVVPMGSTVVAVGSVKGG